MIRHCKPSSVACAWLVLAIGSGCNDGDAQARLDSARQSVKSSLDVWLSGDRAEKLDTGSTPIQFHDDHWKKSARLVKYEIINTYLESDGSARCAVGLTIQYGKKSPEQVQLTYEVVNKDNRIIIARDPFS